ncbi:MAG TPA: hypothetical protein VK858_08385 [Longimicrobiales bacterium]|nr:hypothetical protein [Longimicrobiales bacterium]
MRFSALGRPLDPAWPTNRAVLVLMPVGAFVGWAWSTWGTGARDPLGAVLAGAGAVLGGWALGRELDPDRQGTAFVAMAWAVAAALHLPTSSLLLVFTLLLLARVVNRTAGPAATLLDVGIVLGLTAASVRVLGQPGLGGVAALAFAADAWLGGSRRSAAPAPAALAIAAWGWAGAPGPDWSVPSVRAGAPVALIALAFLAATLTTRRVVAVADRDGAPLDPRRVRWGMLIVLFGALAGVVHGGPGIRDAAMVWAALAAVPVWRALGGDVAPMSQAAVPSRNPK